MSATDIFQPLCTQTKPPEQFYSPFNNQPHVLAVEAAELLQSRLPVLKTATHDFQEVDGGKMLGVLVVQCPQRGIGYLSGFSGMLGGSWMQDGFVPPLFAHDKYQHMLDEGQQQLDSIERERASIAANDNYLQAVADLQSTSAATSQALQEMKLQIAQNKQLRRVQRMENAGKPEVLRQLDEQSRVEKRLRQQHKREAQVGLEAKRQAVESYDVSLQELSVRRKQLSGRLQRRLFDEYVIRSIAAEPVLLRSLFIDKLPPGGAGDCAAVKLLNAAIQQTLVPVCIAEFWWGADSGLRQHGRFYSSCRSKCRVILPHMLQGLDVAAPRYETIGGFAVDEPVVVYEDDYLIVVNKPAGMLSVPGHAISDCVETRLRKMYPQTDNATLLLHRLDQATSGLLVAAKDAASYKNLQRQFEKRTVHKRYIARLNTTQMPLQGEIDLPLRVDLEDRPRQMVCHQCGRRALTRYRLLSTADDCSIVEFLPVTGRTHQLRVHAAHPQGLNAPIVGDEIYGKCADRLYLHAQTLAFTHPATGERLTFSSPTPFYDEGTVPAVCAVNETG